MPEIRYQRVLLKLSGQILAGDEEHGISPARLTTLVSDIHDIVEMGVQVGMVVGGGNIFRGSEAERLGMDRVNADHMGMLATVINALALQDRLERGGLPTHVLSAIEMERLAEPYVRRTAVRHLENGHVVLMAGGTGNPCFTTDTAAVLRAIEIDAEVLLKATRVEGVFTADPITHPEAVFLEKVGYLRVINEGLKVMDSTAISLCMENDLPIIVFDINVKDNLKRVILGEKVGTLVGEG
ncbi:MAG: uridylate kinase [Latescibacteria bacterium DG_63]|nr:MAG: uridylate kinase [Latescibacteria bacterium DG_63]